MMLDLDVAVARGAFTLRVEAHLGPGVTALLGRSGAGKTTLLHLIAGLAHPDRGRISLGGETLYDGARGIAQPPERRRLGLVFQDGRLFPHLTVRANLRYARSAGGRFGEVVDLLELGTLLERRTAQLSGGERQRVALGRALLCAPRMLLLDEPLASLDHVHRGQILPFLRRIRDHEAIPMLYVSHQIEEVLQLTEQILLVEAGRATGPASYRDLTRQPEGFRQLLPMGIRTLLETEVVAEERERGCTRLLHAASGRSLLAPLGIAPPGARVVIAIRAEEVALSRGALSGVSIQNQIPATVLRHALHGGTVLLEADAGFVLCAEISLGAFRELALADGGPVHCLVKSNALRLATDGGA